MVSSFTGWQLTIVGLPLGALPLFFLGLLAVIFGIGLIVGSSMPPPVEVDEASFIVRIPGDKLDRALSWSQVDSVILESPSASSANTYRLVLVPAAGVDLNVPVDYPDKVDGRPSLIIVRLDAVRPTVEEVKQALRRYAGPRFVDMDITPDRA